MNGLRPIGAVESARLTHYGASFNGRSVGCDETLYSSDNASIVAVGPARYGEWPCGTILHICGPNQCLIAERQDACPGCGPNHLDLSEQGLELVCGPGQGVCQASVEAFAPVCRVEPGALEPAEAGSPLQLFMSLAESALQDRTANLLSLSQDSGRPPCMAERPRQQD